MPQSADVEHLDPAFRTSGPDGGKPPKTLHDLDVPEQMAKLDEDLERAVTGYQASRYPQGVSRNQATAYGRKARLLFAVGRKRKAPSPSRTPSAPGSRCTRTARVGGYALLPTSTWRSVNWQVMKGRWL